MNFFEKRQFEQSERIRHFIFNLSAQQSFDKFFEALVELELKDGERVSDFNANIILDSFKKYSNFFILLEEYIHKNNIHIGYTVQSIFERKLYKFIQDNDLKTFKDLNEGVFTLMKLTVLK